MSELKEHAEICPNRPVKCFCGKLMARNLVAEHLKTDDDHLMGLFDRLFELETENEALRRVNNSSSYDDHKHDDVAVERGWRIQVFFFVFIFFTFPPFFKILSPPAPPAPRHFYYWRSRSTSKKKPKSFFNFFFFLG